jgi:hypothetical protein
MENKETIKDRLNLLISCLGISKNQFAKEIGTSSAMISKITTQDINFGVDIIEKIISTFPRINNVWLLTGIGNMFNENVPSDTPSETPFHTPFHTPLVEKSSTIINTNEGVYLESDLEHSEMISDLLDSIIRYKLNYMDFYLIDILYHVKSSQDELKGIEIDSNWYEKKRKLITQYGLNSHSKPQIRTYLKMNNLEKIKLIKTLDELTRDFLDYIWVMTAKLMQ